MEHTCTILSSYAGRKRLNWFTCQACLERMMENAGIKEDYDIEVEIIYD